MIIRPNRFNIYLILCFAVGLTAGCKTEESQRNKQLSTIQLHQEMNPDPMGRTEEIAVYREQPVSFIVSKEPFLNHASIKEAKVIDVMGGFALRIEFDQEGSLLLEQYSSASRSRHIAVFSQWDDTPEEKLNHGRWLAAPKIQTHITDGVFIFTPDASREEAEKIVLGLNNVAKKFATGQPGKW